MSIEDFIKKLVRRFDAWVTRRRGILPVSDEDRCILKVELQISPVDVILPDLSIYRGDLIAKLHLWNGHLPPIPVDKTGLAWAAETWQRFQYSLHLLARLIEKEPSYGNVKAICGLSSLFDLQGKASGARLMERLGFTVIRNPNPLGRFGEFWENLYSQILIWAFNPESLSSHAFTQLQRTGIWMAASDFRERFGEG